MDVKNPIPFDDRKSPATFWADIIRSYSTPGDVVLVPFAGDASIAKAALEQGRRVILLVRTPAQQLRLWGNLTPLDDVETQRALVRLAETTKRDTPLDLHVLGLYQTTCPYCGKPTPATAFIWDSTRGIPVEKELTCAICGFRGRAPADEGDAERAARFERRGLSFWFILEWLVDAQDTAGREIARRYLDKYTPRNLTALADITRKIDAELSDDPILQRILRLRLLHALDAGRQQPDIEHNVWHLLGQAPAADEIDAPVRLAFEPEAFFTASEPMPNVALLAGPVRHLARQLPPGCASLILGAPPLLNTDAWIWEQLWSRWVFGRGAAGGLQPPIGGWARHVRALGATLAVLMPALHAGGRAIFRFQDDDPDRAAALLTAMAPHSTLEDFAYQPRLTEPAHLFDAAGGTYYIAFAPQPSGPSWPGTPDPSTLAETVEATAVDAATDVIRARAEPLTYGWIVTATLVRLARSSLLRRVMVALDPDMSPLAFTRQHMRQGLRAALSTRLLIGVAGDKPTHWWLSEPPAAEPLAERVEQTVIELLQHTSVVRPANVCRQFPGWLTPEAELVEAALSAYGEQIEDGVWRLRPLPPALHPFDLAQGKLWEEGGAAEGRVIVDALRRLGERLGFAVGAGLADVVWGEGGHATHAFRIVETGRWGELEITRLPEFVAGYLVLPDRLAALLRVKLARNPLLRRELTEHHWALVKARHILSLASIPDVDRQEFKKIVGLDPIIEQAEAQMPLF